MTLTAELSAMFARSAKRLSPETKAAFARAAEEFARQKVGETALGIGDLLPDAIMLTVNGDEKSIRSFLENGPLIISFYRGGWCPYCNLELKAYQKILPEIAQAGGTFVAVSPEKPDRSLSTAQKNELSFPVLTDQNLALSKALGIAFEYTEDLIKTYKGFELFLDEIHAGGGWALPVPATYVIGTDGRIILAHVERNYETRLEPTDALKALISKTQ